LNTEKTLGSGFGNSVFILGGMSKGQRGRFCNPTFYKTRQGVIHKKVGPALKHSAKGIKNNLKIEAQCSRLCWSCGGQGKLKAGQSLLTSF